MKTILATNTIYICIYYIFVYIIYCIQIQYIFVLYTNYIQKNLYYIQIYTKKCNIYNIPYCIYGN